MAFGRMFLGAWFWVYGFGRMVWLWAYGFGHMILGGWLWGYQQKLILLLRRGRRFRTHPPSFFRPVRAQFADAIPTTDWVLM